MRQLRKRPHPHTSETLIATSLPTVTTKPLEISLVTMQSYNRNYEAETTIQRKTVAGAGQVWRISEFRNFARKGLSEKIWGEKILEGKNFGQKNVGGKTLGGKNFAGLSHKGTLAKGEPAEL